MSAKRGIYIIVPLVLLAVVYNSCLVADYSRSLKPVLAFMGSEGTATSQTKGMPTAAAPHVAASDGSSSKALHPNSTWPSAWTSSTKAAGESGKENSGSATHSGEGGGGSAEKPEKKILFYTRFFSEGWQTILGNRTNLTLQGCPETRCVFTFDPAGDQDDADALIFHANDFDAEAVPRARRPHQRYIWFNLEAPAPQGAHQRGRPWERDFFNWTFTYNRDSDLFMPYGALAPLQAEEQNLSGRPALLNKSSTTFLKYMQDLNNNVSLEDDLQHDWSSFLRRPKIVAWMVSNCNTWSGREKYVKELQNHVQVDVYGRCGSLTCGKNHRDTYCYTDVLAVGYRFYLSFENSLCRDYVTEKVWFPMLHGLVPVVYGGATYEDYLPPHSYIDARAMSPKDLAELLIRVSNSRTEYARYHLWRRYWRPSPFPPFCELCSKLHRDSSAATVADLRGWWTAANNCTSPRTSAASGGSSLSERFSGAAKVLTLLAKTALQVVP